MHDPAIIDSDALRANLEETAVDKVVVPDHLRILEEIVADYRGLRDIIGGLLYEVSHPYRNWNLLLPRLRSFILKNLGHYLRHPRGPEGVEAFSSILFSAVHDAGRNHKLAARALEIILAMVEKTVSSLVKPDDLHRFSQCLDRIFADLTALDREVILPVVQGQHPVKKIAEIMIHRCGPDHDLAGIASLFKTILLVNYDYWLAEDDPLEWFTVRCGDLCQGWKAGRLFAAISHEQLRVHRQTALAVDTAKNGREGLVRLLGLPNHLDIVRLYRQLPDKLVDEVGETLAADRFAENRKLLFLFRIMETRGLFLIHEETLREINRGLIQLVRIQSFEEIESFLLTTFRLLKVNVRHYPHTSLQCIQVLGAEVFKRGNSRLVESFLWETVRFGFQYPGFRGIDEEWQPLSNPAHLDNIRVWLSLIMQEPKWCSTLFSALIINLKLAGTCVRDTDLFQRDISRLLNHPVEPVYNLVKQFAKLMPVFFNEIGAEGLLRDVSTEIDEVLKRGDPLIHFLRKQSHVESSNVIVDFIRAIFSFWHSLDIDTIRPFLPVEVISRIKKSGPLVDGVHALSTRALEQRGVRDLETLCSWDERKLGRFLDSQDDVEETDKKRFALLLKMYRLVRQKYDMDVREIGYHLDQAASFGFPEMAGLLDRLEGRSPIQALEIIMGHLEELQAIILSPETFPAREDIYHKRHIAVDIPSVYGCYRERKFDALGLTFRLENLANIYLERLGRSVNLTFITKATFIRIIKCLRIFLRALKIDGIRSRRLETYLSLLSGSLGIKRFSYTQYLDIFRGLSEGVKDVIYAHYTNIHENNLSIIIPQVGGEAENLHPTYRRLWDPENTQASQHRISEAFFRDLIATTFGLQHLDNFITRIYQTLENQKDILDEKSLDLLMTYNPERAVSPIHRPESRGGNLILLGNKGYNLSLMARDGLPVPPGFIITTEVFRCWPVVGSFSRAREELMGRIRDALTEVEKTHGHRFGDPDNPLLVSVRSGASISMPGMMATIHNVGINADIAAEFAEHGSPYLAWDNYRRFLQSWAMTAGVEREEFQALMDQGKKRAGVAVKREFSPDQIRDLALEYRSHILERGIDIPEDPWLQLIGAVEMVLSSWNTVKTRHYRSLMDISDSWGTAVIVQTMVFGNRNDETGSGVLFTAHPYRKVRRVALWGDYAVADQGEDIVSGLVATYPISIEQAEIDGRDRDRSLEARFPEVYERLLSISRELVYVKGWNPQEMEFTFEGPKADNLYLLQTRDMITIRKKESFWVFTDLEKSGDDLLGKGIGVSGSAMSGVAVFTRANIDEMRRKKPKTPLILIRQDTVPEDILEISMADGLLTARGGQTSHASVVAIRLEKTCVVGCHPLQVHEAEERAVINGREIRYGDPVSIDGRQGLFLKGRHPVRREVHILPG